MTWFFDDPAAGERLQSAAWAWHGTPFAEFARVQGPQGGIDCVGFVEEVMAAAGLPRFSFPRARNDYSRHVHNAKVLDYLRGKATLDRGLGADEAEVTKSGGLTITIDPQSAQLAALFAEFPVKERRFEESAAERTGAPRADLFTEPPMIGDLLICREEGRTGKTGNGVFHMPVMMARKKFMHCAPRLKVVEGNIDDPTYHAHLVAHFRARRDAPANPTTAGGAPALQGDDLNCRAGGAPALQGEMEADVS